MSRDVSLGEYECAHLKFHDSSDADSQLNKSWFTLPVIKNISSKSGCACDFRVWSHDFGFVPPQGWSSESIGDDKIIGAQALLSVIRNLIRGGISIEIVMKWSDTPLANDEFKIIDTNSIDDYCFYLFDDYKMRFV